MSTYLSAGVQRTQQELEQRLEELRAEFLAIQRADQLTRTRLGLFGFGLGAGNLAYLLGWFASIYFS